MPNASFNSPLLTHKFQLMEHMYPHICISPFLPDEWQRLLDNGSTTGKEKVFKPTFWLDGARDMKFLYSGRLAIQLCLENLRLKKTDEVLIVTTTQGPYISSCVTKTIEKICRWSRDFTLKTRAVLVIHEFGFPYPAAKMKMYQEKGLPVIEDCAYAIGSRLSGAPVGTFGDYAVYSLAKYFPIPFGGLLIAKSKIKENWTLAVDNDSRKLMQLTIKNAIRFHKTWDRNRILNWKFFADRLKALRIRPYFTLKQGIIPGVFLAKVPKGFTGSVKKTYLNKVGVESTEYYGQGGFYFPVHQFLTDYEKKYILHHFIHHT